MRPFAAYPVRKRVGTGGTAQLEPMDAWASDKWRALTMWRDLSRVMTLVGGNARLHVLAGQLLQHDTIYLDYDPKRIGRGPIAGAGAVAGGVEPAQAPAPTQRPNGTVTPAQMREEEGVGELLERDEAEEFAKLGVALLRQILLTGSCLWRIGRRGCYPTAVSAYDGDLEHRCHRGLWVGRFVQRDTSGRAQTVDRKADRAVHVMVLKPPVLTEHTEVIYSPMDRISFVWRYPHGRVLDIEDGGRWGTDLTDKAQLVRIHSYASQSDFMPLYRAYNRLQYHKWLLDRSTLMGQEPGAEIQAIMPPTDPGHQPAVRQAGVSLDSHNARGPGPVPAQLHHGYTPEQGAAAIGGRVIDSVHMRRYLERAMRPSAALYQKRGNTYGPLARPFYAPYNPTPPDHVARIGRKLEEMLSDMMGPGVADTHRSKVRGSSDQGADRINKRNQYFASVLADVLTEVYRSMIHRVHGADRATAQAFRISIRPHKVIYPSTTEKLLMINKDNPVAQMAILAKLAGIQLDLGTGRAE